MNVLLTPTTPLQGILGQGAPRIPYSGEDHNDVFENAFQEYSNGSGSICQPSGWRQKTERADYKLLSQEQTPPSGTSPPSTGPQSEHTYTSPQLLGFFTSSDYYSTSYQDSNSQYACQPTAFTDAPLDAATFGQQGYPLFHQEIENSFERRRESARRSTTDQVQNDVYNLPTPLSAPSAPSTSEDSEFWRPSSQTPMPPTFSTVHGILPKLETGRDASALPTQDKPERAIKRRYRKKKKLSDSEVIFRRNAFLARNRQAANKCRTRKKDRTKQLQEDARVGRLRNDELRKEHYTLMEEVRELQGAVALCEAEDEWSAREQAGEVEELIPGDSIVEGFDT